MAVRAGNYRETAARFAGIGPATLHRWLGDPRAPYVALREALNMVEAEVEVEVVANLVRLSRTSTSAAVFWLERRHPERWAFLRRHADAGTAMQVIIEATTQPTPEVVDAATLFAPGPATRQSAQAAGRRSGDHEL
jgi:hypothetical protein